MIKWLCGLIAGLLLTASAFAANPMLLATQTYNVFQTIGVANFAHYSNGAITSTGPFTNGSTGTTGRPTVSSGVLSPSVVSEAETAYWSGNTFQNDQFCSLKVAALGSANNAVGCTLRMSGGNNGYFCYIGGPTGASAFWGINVVVAGSTTVIIAPTTMPVSLSAGDFIGCHIVGDLLEFDYLAHGGGGAPTQLYLADPGTFLTGGAPGVYVETVSGTLANAGVNEVVLGNVMINLP